MCVINERVAIVLALGAISGEVIRCVCGGEKRSQFPAPGHLMPA